MAEKEQKSTLHLSPFDAIRHVDEQLGEYWSARELYKILGYTEWRNFHNVVIKRALKACEENGRAVSEHFVQSYKMSKTGQGGKRRTEDVLLSRYAAYLLVKRRSQNADRGDGARVFRRADASAGTCPLSGHSLELRIKMGRLTRLLLANRSWHAY